MKKAICEGGRKSDKAAGGESEGGLWKGCRFKKRVQVQAQVEMPVIRSEGQ